MILLSVCRRTLGFRGCPERFQLLDAKQESNAHAVAQQTATNVYFILGIFILYPCTFYTSLLKTIKWCRLFSQWEQQIGLRQLCLICIFQSGKRQKSRLISLTDSGRLGYFVFIKVKLPWVASGIPPMAYLFKHHCWTKFIPGLDLVYFSFGLWFFMPRLTLQTSAALSKRVFSNPGGHRGTADGQI